MKDDDLEQLKKIRDKLRSKGLTDYELQELVESGFLRILANPKTQDIRVRHIEIFKDIEKLIKKKEGLAQRIKRIIQSKVDFEVDVGEEGWNYLCTKLLGLNVPEVLPKKVKSIERQMHEKVIHSILLPSESKRVGVVLKSKLKPFVLEVYKKDALLLRIILARDELITEGKNVWGFNTFIEKLGLGNYVDDLIDFLRKMPKYEHTAKEKVYDTIINEFSKKLRYTKNVNAAVINALEEASREILGIIKKSGIDGRVLIEIIERAEGRRIRSMPSPFEVAIAAYEMGLANVPATELSRLNIKEVLKEGKKRISDKVQEFLE